MKRTTIALVAGLAACSGTGNGDAAGGNGHAEPGGFELPVVTNAESPVAYPPDLYDQGVVGTVVLRLYVDETGVVDTDSVAIVESSGNIRLDSAALEGVVRMQFAPARQDGSPIAATFLQPVQFRNPETASGSER